MIMGVTVMAIVVAVVGGHRLILPAQPGEISGNKGKYP
jgi:hypothetical protein